MSDSNRILKATTLSVACATSLGPTLPHIPNPLQVEFSDLEFKNLRRLAPVQVLTWLFGRKYDAFDVAKQLCIAKFEGQFSAICHSLPLPEIVYNEMAREFPNLRFNLFCLPEAKGDDHSYERKLHRPKCSVSTQKIQNPIKAHLVS